MREGFGPLCREILRVMAVRKWAGVRLEFFTECRAGSRLAYSTSLAGTGLL